MIFLNHLNLTVPDVSAARLLFEKYFDFKAEGLKPNDTMAILKGADGFLLVLMNENMNRGGNMKYPDNFHIGFQQKESSGVTGIYQKLKVGGVELPQEPQLIRGSLGFYFTHQNIMIEVASLSN